MRSTRQHGDGGLYGRICPATHITFHKASQILSGLQPSWMICQASVCMSDPIVSLARMLICDITCGRWGYQVESGSSPDRRKINVTPFVKLCHILLRYIRLCLIRITWLGWFKMCQTRSYRKLWAPSMNNIAISGMVVMAACPRGLRSGQPLPRKYCLSFSHQ